MSTHRMIPADLSKEIRALLPLWLGCIAIVSAGGFSDLILFPAGFITWLLGSAALGALSIGHEYTHRTLPLVLSMPVSRRRTFAMKASVLLPMLVILAAVAVVRLPVAPAGRDLKDTMLVGLLSLLSSAFLAPWLTMVCRNVIAGALFSLSITSAALVGSELVTIAVYGAGQLDGPVGQHFRMELLWGSMLLLSAVGAISSWRAFMTLETIEGSRLEVRLPGFRDRSVSSAPARHGQRIHPVWSLVRKELHLQQLTFVVPALYVCGWIATLVLRRLLGGGDVEDVLLILTVVNGAIVALLSGSLASAEERHLGVLESQVLMPISTVQQWAIKAGVVFGLCLLLAMALPAALILGSQVARSVSINVPFVVMVILLAAVGLYVSSVSSSGVKALMMSGPAALSLVVLIPLLGDSVLWAARLAGIRLTHDIHGRGPTALIGVMIFSLLMGFGLSNHRSSDRSALGIWRQILWLSGSVACIMLIALFAR